MYNLAWAVLLVPMAAFAFSFLPETPRRAAQVCVAGSAATFALAVVVLVYRLGHATNNPYQSVVTFWTFNPGTLVRGSFLSDFHPEVGVLVDGLSAVFSAVVALVVLLVQTHALASMRGDAGYRRLFATTTFLLFAAIGLVATPNLFGLYIAWELAGVCGALLVAHEWQRLSAVRAARRMLVLTRPGDLSLLLALVFLFVKLAPDVALQPLAPGQDVNDPFNVFNLAAEAHRVHAGLVVGAGTRTLVVLGVLLTVAGLLRAAQMPFHSWVDGAVEAPPAGAAVVHASTVTLAGVYLLLRTDGALATAPHILTAVGIVGAWTAASMAVGTLAASDVRRIAVRAAVAQLGLALAALGGGAPGAAALMLLAGVLASPLLMLAGGDLARAYRTADVHEMGGALRRMPWTAWTLIAGCASAGGVVLLGGYWAHVAVVRGVLDGEGAGGAALGGGARVLVVVLVLAALLVMPLALLRVALLTCGGEPVRRRGFQPDRVREAGAPVRIPLAVLALLAVTVGFAGIDGAPWSVQHFTVASSAVPAASTAAYALAAVVPLLGAGIGALLYGRRVIVAASLAARFAPAAAAAALLPPSAEDLDRFGGLVRRPAAGLARVDDDVTRPVVEAAGEGMDLVSALATVGLRSRRVYALTALAGVALLAGGVTLAATGHLPGVGATR